MLFTKEARILAAGMRPAPSSLERTKPKVPPRSQHGEFRSAIIQRSSQLKISGRSRRGLVLNVCKLKNLSR